MKHFIIPARVRLNRSIIPFEAGWLGVVLVLVTSSRVQTELHRWLWKLLSWLLCSSRGIPNPVITSITNLLATISAFLVWQRISFHPSGKVVSNYQQISVLSLCFLSGFFKNVIDHRFNYIVKYCALTTTWIAHSQQVQIGASWKPIGLALNPRIWSHNSCCHRE